MPHHFIIFALIAIIGVALVKVFSNINARRKRIEAIKAAYGRFPVVDEYIQMESISRYARLYETNNPSQKRVDPITWNDLDMDKVFNRINACQTSVGEEYLYHCLHQLPLNGQALKTREGLIQFFANNPDTRLEVQILLASNMGKENYNGLTSLMHIPNINLLKYRHLFTALGILPMLLPLIMLVNVPIGAISLVASYVINMMVHFRNKHRVAIDGHNSIKYLTSMLRCCKRLIKMKSLQAQPVMGEIKKYHKTLKSIKRNVPATTSIAGDFADTMFEYINIMFLYDIRKYNNFMTTVKKHSQEFHALYRAFGEVDMSICIASFRQSLPEYALPEFTTETRMEFTDIYHPLIPSPIANSCDISKNSVITGSNASGKSTFIKALAINSILAQTINTCAAKAFTARFSLVVSSMVMRDDLTAGDSYFIVEIKSLKRILDLVQEYPCTCFIDEILRGTNTIERIAASAAVLEYLSGQNALCVAASHDIELTRILEGKYDNYHFREQVTDDGVVFDYKINNGPSTTRNAIKLLGFMGFTGSIIERAENLAEDLANI